MALGLRMLNARFTSSRFPGIRARVWTLASDGDMMEGLSTEAGSLAGHLGLGNLNVVYDSNDVTIDGRTSLTFSEDVGRRFAALGWHVLHVDGHNRTALAGAFRDAEQQDDAPVLIISKTTIAKDVPGREGDHRLHGSPLGAESFAALKENVGLDDLESFEIPPEAYDPFTMQAERGIEECAQWKQSFGEWRRAEPHEAKRWDALFEHLTPRLPDMAALQKFFTDAKPTRSFSGRLLQAIGPDTPWLVGGSADLTSSNNVLIETGPPLSRDDFGRRMIHFGIREHAMGAVCNGLALTKAFRPFAATFLVFSDYMRPSIRMAALMGLPVVYIFTHDSIFVGEDGPTHQPVEQLPSLRAIPGLIVIRPADGYEVAGAWAFALEREHGPTALVLSRQKVGILPRSGDTMPPIERGAYVVVPAKDPDVVVIATGSEVDPVVHAARLLDQQGIAVHVVSMPCVELFLTQPETYQKQVLVPGVPRVAVEAATLLGWERVIGIDGLFIGMTGFGASAPAETLKTHFGFDAETIAERLSTWLEIQNADREER
jgi:transketolase